MCGIAGFIDLSQSPAFGREALTEQAQRAMADMLVHRGPNDSGVWVDPAAGVALGFRRLAIIDLSPAGHQPMESSDGRFVIIFNGEIYNHRELRRQLEQGNGNLQFRGHSDTEVLLAAIGAWGLQTTLTRAVGMFALAVWDRRERLLSLARDRLGEKPLYYGIVNRRLLFASEMKALYAHSAFDDTIDQEALALYMRHGYIPGPHSIYKHVRKLAPGTFVECAVAELRRSPQTVPEPTAYWSARAAAEMGAALPFDGDYDAATNQLEHLLRKSIAGQMVADVPVGAFLSGGIDSSTIVALMQTQSDRRIKTFSIGFHETEFNEACHAKKVAEHIGTEHTELYVTAEEARQVIPSLPSIYDEPFADSSQIPTYLVSQLACRHVTVSLSGDGGDELFAGYTRYGATHRLWQALRCMPAVLRRPFARTLQKLPAKMVDALLFWLAPMANRHGAPARVSSKVFRLAHMMEQNCVEGLYQAIVSYAGPAADLVLRGGQPRSLLNDPSAWAQLEHPQEIMMYLDQMTYLPDDILTKVDRAAMAVSLETRVPLLDHHLVEFAWSLPFDFKQRDGKRKAILREVLAKYVPMTLTDRPKMGFGVPIGQWLRGPLREWAEDLLSPQSMSRDGLLDASAVNRMWQEHVTLRREWQHQLWAVLMFQAWSAERRKASPTIAKAA